MPITTSLHSRLAFLFPNLFILSALAILRTNAINDQGLIADNPKARMRGSSNQWRLIFELSICCLSVLQDCSLTLPSSSKHISAFQLEVLTSSKTHGVMSPEHMALSLNWGLPLYESSPPLSASDLGRFLCHRTTIQYEARLHCLRCYVCEFLSA